MGIIEWEEGLEPEEMPPEEAAGTDDTTVFGMSPLRAFLFVFVVFWIGVIGYSVIRHHFQAKEYQGFAELVGNPELAALKRLRLGTPLHQQAPSTVPKLLIVCWKNKGESKKFRAYQSVDPLMSEAPERLRPESFGDITHVLFLNFDRTYISDYNYAFEKGYRERCEGRLWDATTGKLVDQITFSGGLPPESFEGSKGTEVFGTRCDEDIAAFVERSFPR